MVPPQPHAGAHKSGISRAFCENHLIHEDRMPRGFGRFPSGLGAGSETKPSIHTVLLSQ